MTKRTPHSWYAPAWRVVLCGGSLILLGIALFSVVFIDSVDWRSAFVRSYIAPFAEPWKADWLFSAIPYLATLLGLAVIGKRRKAFRLAIDAGRLTYTREGIFRAFGWRISFDEILIVRTRGIPFTDIRHIYVAYGKGAPESIIVHLKNDRTYSIRSIAVLPEADRKDVVARVEKEIIVNQQQ